MKDEEMKMKQTITLNHFRNAFMESERKNNFSLEGLDNLFDYFESLEDDTGIEIELDVIAICCDFTEYETLADFQADYGDEYETADDIEYVTTLIMFGDSLDDGFIIQSF